MNRILRSSVALLLATCALQACASTTGAKRAQRTITTSQKLATAVEQLDLSVEGVRTAITGLRDSVGKKGIIQRTAVAEGDIPAAYDSYASAVKGYESARKKVASLTGGLGKEITAYLQTWETEMAQVTNEDLRATAQERREKVRTRYGELETELTDLRSAYDQFGATISEIRVALANDLTPQGVAGVDDTLEKTSDTAEDLRERLAKVTADLRAYAEDLRATAPPPPPAES